MMDERESTLIREKISDYYTLNVSDYDPSGFENVQESVLFLNTYRAETDALLPLS